ncbi:MAG: phosphoribosylanthranilate isomerase [Actinobacteria bacterium]|nr:phosphoribosylanthranilate isomerase [Actinomycetota bacterium]
MFVKVCGITNEDDALLAVAMGADAVGFVFAPSPRQVAPQVVYDITRRLPPEILTVGVFRDELPDRVFEVASRAGVKAVQLHGRETARHVSMLADNIRWIIKGVSAGSPAAARANEYGTDLVLVDAPEPGSGRLFDWKLVDEIPGGLRLILAGGLTPENVGSAIDIVKPWGVDVSSGVESSPGRKDAVKVRRFIAAARAAAPAEFESGDDDVYDWTDE